MGISQTLKAAKEIRQRVREHGTGAQRQCSEGNQTAATDACRTPGGTSRRKSKGGRKPKARHNHGKTTSGYQPTAESCERGTPRAGRRHRQTARQSAKRTKPMTAGKTKPMELECGERAWQGGGAARAGQISQHKDRGRALTQEPPEKAKQTAPNQKTRHPSRTRPRR